MNAEFYIEPVPHCVIRNVYTQDDTDKIFKEIDFLKTRLKDPKFTGSALFPDGNPKKRNTGMFLEETYGLPQFSDIVTINRKLFPVIVDIVKDKHWVFRYLTGDAVKITTLLSCYDEEDYYKSHIDQGVLTCISYIWREPKTFEGGDLYFGDYRVPIENNSLLLFPSCTEHEVKNVTGHGRFSITQFVTC